MKRFAIVAIVLFISIVCVIAWLTFLNNKNLDFQMTRQALRQQTILTGLIIVAIIPVSLAFFAYHRRMVLNVQKDQFVRKIKHQTAVFQEVNDAVITADRNGVILSWNTGASKLLGWDENDVVMKDISILFREKDVDASRMFLKTEGLRQESDEEFTVICKDGEENVIRRTVSAIRNETGKTIGYVAIIHDLTDKKKLDRMFLEYSQDLERRIDERTHQLRNSELKFKNLVENANEGIIIIDPNREMTFANPRAAKMLGYKYKELLGKDLLDFVVRHKRPQMRKELRIRSAGFKSRYETRFVKRDGIEIPLLISATPIMNDEGAFIGSYGVFTDLTELKKAENQIRRLKEYNESLIENANVLIIAGDIDERIVTFNKAFRSMTGFLKRETKGRKIEFLFRGESIRDFRNFMERLKRKKNITGINLRVQLKTGEPRTVNFNGAMLLDEENNARGVLLVGQDITEVVLAEDEIRTKNEELARANEELTHLNDMKSNFLSMVSHELKSPLTTIKGYINFILKGQLGEISCEQNRVLGIVEKQVDLLEHLIGELLDLSRLESKDYQFPLKKMDIYGIIVNCVSSLREKARERNVRITNRIHAGMPSLSVNPEKMTQVFTNLLDNAIKFSEEGGKIFLSAEEIGSGIRICVSDTGLGISEENLGRIFEKFFQADASESRKYKGAGLGLSITRGIIQKHGGDIWVESELDIGSHFYFTLPLPRKLKRGDSEKKAGESRWAFMNRTILVVDDDPDIVEYICDLLEREKACTVKAYGGEECLRKMEAHHVDLILLDNRMPDLDGKTVGLRLKKEPRWRSIPIIVISATGNESELAMRFKDISRGFLIKPFQAEKLLMMIHREMGGSLND